MKCRILFSGKNKNVSCHLLTVLPRMLIFKSQFYMCQFIKPFLDNKMSIFGEYGAFKFCTLRATNLIF